MKKKIVLASIVALSLALLVAVGVTVAYLFVETDPVENIFTPSDINVSIEESAINGTTMGNSYKMIPGEDMFKDPKVTASGDIPYYVFVKIVENGEVTIGENKYFFDDFLAYAIADEWKVLSGDTGNTTTGNDTIVIYREMAANTALTNEPVLAGNKVTTSTEVTKQMMNAYTDGSIKLTFTAYAVQQLKGTDASGVDTYFTAAEAWAIATASKN